MLLDRFYPDECQPSAYEIDYQKWYEDGYRGLIFDIDNTLVPHGAPADERAIALFRKLKEIGFSCCFISNNHIERVASFNSQIHALFIENAHKPSRKSYWKAMEMMGTDTGNTISIGDQLFTDIYGSKRAGIYSILVGQIDRREEIQIYLKRILEKIVLFFYKRQGGRS